MSTERDLSSVVTWRTLLTETIDVLAERPQARWLCEAACGLQGDEFLAELDEPATQRMVSQLDAMVARYRSGEPLAYVLGSWSFRTLDLMIDKRVLIPRPETELVAGRAIELARSFTESRCVVDLGTGSGAIGLSMAAELSIVDTQVWLTDNSPDALNVAQANAAGLGRSGANVRFALGTWFEALSREMSDDLHGQVQVIVSNPPYIANDDREVHESVLEWEPHAALFAGNDGLDDVRVIINGAREWLCPSGWLVLEIGYQQGEAVSALMRQAGFVDVSVGDDLSGRQRFVEGRNPSA